MSTLRGSSYQKVSQFVENFENDFKTHCPSSTFKEIVRNFKALKSSYQKNIAQFYRHPITDGTFVYDKSTFLEQQQLKEIKKDSFALKVFEKFDCYLEGFKNLLSNKIVSFTYGELEIFFCNHTNYKTIFDNDLSAIEQKIYEYRNGNIDLQNQDFFEKEFL